MSASRVQLDWNFPLRRMRMMRHHQHLSGFVANSHYLCARSIPNYGSMRVACVSPAKEQGHACGLDRVNARTHRTLPSGARGSWPNTRRRGFGLWRMQCQAGWRPLRCLPAYWWVRTPPGATPACGVSRVDLRGRRSACIGKRDAFGAVEQTMAKLAVLERLSRK